MRLVYEACNIERNRIGECISVWYVLQFDVALLAHSDTVHRDSGGIISNAACMGFVLFAAAMGTEGEEIY